MLSAQSTTSRALIIFTTLALSCISQAAYIFPRGQDISAPALLDDVAGHVRKTLDLVHDATWKPSLKDLYKPNEPCATLEQIRQVRKVDRITGRILITYHGVDPKKAEALRKKYNAEYRVSMKNGLSEVFNDLDYLDHIQRSCVRRSGERSFIEDVYHVVIDTIKDSSEVTLLVEGRGQSWPKEELSCTIIPAVNSNPAVTSVQGFRMYTVASQQPYSIRPEQLIWEAISIPTEKYNNGMSPVVVPTEVGAVHV